MAMTAWLAVCWAAMAACWAACLATTAWSAVCWAAWFRAAAQAAATALSPRCRTPLATCSAARPAPLWARCWMR